MRAAAEAIVATTVPLRQRSGALPRAFGLQHMLLVEGAVFDRMGELDSGYSGGFWEFRRLSNGGFFMHPTEGTREISSPNGRRGSVSEEAAGAIACLFAYSHLCFHLSDCDRIAENFHLLREFALGHPEAPAIFAAID